METAKQTRTTNQKNDRLNLRLSKEQRSILDEAAAASGMTVGTFVLSHATDAARNLLVECSGEALPEQRWSNFLALLDRDPPPGSSLLAEASSTRQSACASRSCPCSPRL